MENARCIWPRGKVLGGSSSINDMIYSRGNKKDYDHWASLGNPGWSYKDVLPYFRKSEDIQIPELKDSPYHSTGGPLTVSQASYRTPLGTAFLQASEELGYPTRDYNGECQSGFGRPQLTIRGGHRCSAAKAFLRPARHRHNLDIAMHSHVTRVIIDPTSKVAYGVEFVRDGKTFVVTAEKEVILSAGAVQTPHLLMLSGVGPKTDLEQLSIPVLQDLKVGHNLLDHVGVTGVNFRIDEPVLTSDRRLDLMNAVLEFADEGSGILTLPNFEAFGNIQTKYVNASEDWPDVQLGIFPFAAINTGDMDDQVQNQTGDGHGPFGPMATQNQAGHSSSCIHQRPPRPVLIRGPAYSWVDCVSQDPFRPITIQNQAGHLMDYFRPDVTQVQASHLTGDSHEIFRQFATPAAYSTSYEKLRPQRPDVVQDTAHSWSDLVNQEPFHPIAMKDQAGHLMDYFKPEVTQVRASHSTGDSQELFRQFTAQTPAAYSTSYEKQQLQRPNVVEDTTHSWSDYVNQDPFRPIAIQNQAGHSMNYFSPDVTQVWASRSTDNINQNSFRPIATKKQAGGFLGDSDSIRAGPIDAWGIVLYLNRPKSKGHLRLRSKNPFDHPLLTPNYFTEAIDLLTLVEGVKMAVTMGETWSMQQFGSRFDSINRNCSHIALYADAYWECAIRYKTRSGHHPAGTCKMGPFWDPTAVVDSQLRVYGIERLRVMDASIMPTLPSGNSNAPTIMIGEKGADLIKETWFSDNPPLK